MIEKQQKQIDQLKQQNESLIKHFDESIEKSNETILKIQEEKVTAKKRRKEPRELDPTMKV